MRKIESLVVHCSVSKWGDVAIIDEWHKARGWKGCGYTYVILNGKRKNSKQYDINDDGLIEGGRNIDNDMYLQFNERGAHAYGYNSNSFGVCLIGDKTFTPRQFDSLIYLVSYWKKLIPNIKILGHYELNKRKTCPNFSVEKLREYLKGFKLTPSTNFFFGDYIGA